MDLVQRIDNTRSNIEAGIRNASLDGLRLAALGAVLIGLGDSLGAWMIFSGA
jgi:hypothetical protein